MPSVGICLLTFTAQSLYMPSSAERLSRIPVGTVPYVSANDLIVFSLLACKKRGDPGRQAIYADDAKRLLRQESAPGPLNLTRHQQACVEPCIVEVIRYAEGDPDSWRVNLGLH